MTIAIAMAVTLLSTTSLFHFAVLRWLSGGMARIPMTPAFRVFVIVICVFFAHLVEISLYAAAFAVGKLKLGLGDFGGESIVVPLDYLYFSIVSYTSLGIGDIFPSDHLRFITGVEALNGLLLIAWSGSFIFTAMAHLWPWEKCANPDDYRSNR